MLVLVLWRSPLAQLTAFACRVLQPALLYLSPACLLFSVLPSLVRGEFRALTAYTDDEEEAEGEKSDKDKKDGDAKTAGSPEDTSSPKTNGVAVNGNGTDSKGDGLRKRVGTSSVGAQF